MPIVTFLPTGKTVDVPPGTELLDAARIAGVDIDSPCGGKGTCGKCVVLIRSGDVDTDSLGALSQAVVSAGNVLACKTRVLDTPIVVDVPEQAGRKGGKFGDETDDVNLIRHELLPKNWQYDPLAIKWFVDVPPPQAGEGLSDFDRLVRRLQLEWGKKEFVCPLSVMRLLAGCLRVQNGQVTVTMVRESDRYHIIGIEPGNSTVEHYGIAIDVGTTTIAVQLVFLPLAKIVAVRSDYNSQIWCGQDVISRINYARREDRREELRTRVLSTINNLIRQVAESHNVTPQRICNAVISANTTMTHLLLGLNPEYIRLEPYTPTLLEVPYLSASDIGIDISPESWVYISPSVGSYVGGDITAGLLCTDIAIGANGFRLFIDIGTNGEIVIGDNEVLMTCACSAGPAFEGGGIEFGMRAAIGAIERIEVNPQTGVPNYSTIGNTKPRGICGSGMISLLAELFLTGWLDGAGKLNRQRKSDAIIIDGRHAKYIIAQADETYSEKALTISEVDIENIIRAKAAIYSACSLMVQMLGCELADLEKIYIGGGFGRFLDIRKAIVIGLIPDLPHEKFQYIGNSSLMGSYMVLVSDDYRDRQLELAKRMTYIDLSTEPSYMDQYTAAMFLPHTDSKLFPSVKN
ncbi:MAG: hypothetical protein A2Y10_18710 [Planctomycetes bacterium GWF2_41_51]|nr:MAG: hypothetical protein A2Y10_18710 [Planctomycetes bacterium GWF2_41_51]HBG27120.1 ferredoxin [Phycisphaerales bacterium]